MIVSYDEKWKLPFGLVFDCLSLNSFFFVSGHQYMYILIKFDYFTNEIFFMWTLVISLSENSRIQILAVDVSG